MNFLNILVAVVSSLGEEGLPIHESTQVTKVKKKLISTALVWCAMKLKGGFNLNVIFPPLDMALMEISRSRFKQSKNSTLIP